MAQLPNRAGIIALCSSNENIFVLLVRYNRKDNKVYWDIPRGHIEKGESAKQTAIREFYEETGIKVSSNLYRAGTIEYAARTRSVLIHYNITYYATTFTRCIKPSPIDIKEIAEAKWVSFYEAINLLETNQIAQIVKSIIYFRRKKLL